MIDVQKQNKEALKLILNYTEMRKAYIDATAAYSEIAATAYTGMPHGSGTSNPTQNKAVKLVDIDALKDKLMVVEAMEKTLSEKKRPFLEFRRIAEIQEPKGAGKPPWADYVQAKFSDWHMKSYGCACVPTRQTMKDWMDRIVDVTVRIAIKNGLM